MNEKLLQFIWQHQYFNKSALLTHANEPVEIFFPGNLNTDQGPDFLMARIKIGRELWIGSVELHLQSTGWKKHGHDADNNYKNVVLHVVWQNDDVGTDLPVIELNSRVPGWLLERYKQLMSSSARSIPCSTLLHQVNTLIWISWLDRLLIERLQRKTAGIYEWADSGKIHWEQAFWEKLARGFGLLKNAEAFEAMAQSLALKILFKHRNNLLQLEALLMGQAGLLEKTITNDDYYTRLQQEYRFLKNKYQLLAVQVPLYFLRLRPQSFPTLRLSQLAVLIHHYDHIFSRVMNAEPKDITECFRQVKATTYWNTHFVFGSATRYSTEKKLGTAAIENIIINVVVPFLFVLADYKNRDAYKKKALQLLLSLPAEKNAIVKEFAQWGIKAGNAAESQALLTLKNDYCNIKACLNCAVGNSLMKK